MARPSPACLAVFSKRKRITSPPSEPTGRRPANSNPSSRARLSQVAPSPKRRIRAFGNMRRQLRNAEICTASVFARLGLGELKRITWLYVSRARLLAPEFSSFRARTARPHLQPQLGTRGNLGQPRKASVRSEERIRRLGNTLKRWQLELSPLAN